MSESVKIVCMCLNGYCSSKSVCCLGVAGDICSVRSLRAELDYCNFLAVKEISIIPLDSEVEKSSLLPCVMQLFTLENRTKPT